MNTDRIVEQPSLERHAEDKQPDIVPIRPGLAELQEQARALIRERPVVAVLAAIGVGYLAARIVSRMMR